MIMDKIFIRVFYDSDNIKDASIWKIGLADSEAHMLYIETLHENVSENISKETYYKNAMESYFKGLIGIDKKLGNLEMIDDITGLKSNDLNIFVDDDIKIKEKIISFIKEFTTSDRILLYFKDSFEQVLFFNFVKNIFKENNINIISKNLESLNINIDTMEMYSKVCKDSITNTLKEVEGNADITNLIVYMRIILECLILKDIYSYMTSEDNDTKNEG